MRRILEAGHRAKVFRAPVLEAPASLMESLHSIQGLRAADVLPTSAAKIEHSKTLFTRHTPLLMFTCSQAKAFTRVSGDFMT